MNKPQTTPKDFFLYVGAIIALYVSAGSLLAVLFSIIGAIFPDAVARSYDYYNGGMRFAIASLIIIFPMYIALSWIIRRDIVANPEKRELSVRKWLVYLTLFVTGLVVVGDLVTVLNVFLGGEVTVRFIAKVIATLVVSGAIFGYYLYDIRRSADENKRVSRIIVVASAAFVLGTLVWGFAVMGSPSKARNLRFDDTRTSDLQSIQWQIINVWQQKGALPAQLSDLNDSLSYFSLPIDPETGASYVYEKTAAKAFKLCATFALGTADGAASGVSASVVRPYGVTDTNWKHSAGTHCFERTIDAALYPVNAKAI
ncbi:MAG: DUF5671 domain-containing protein [Candidatus Paceibacterota bacterium]|jgi:hypothetical protein